MNMRKGRLTRDQAIAVVGIDAVNDVDAKSCDFTSRVQTDGDTDIEFSAGVEAIDIVSGEQVTLIAYYYQDRDALDAVEQLDDLSWEIEGYEFNY
jgi:hypothetical protein